MKQVHIQELLAEAKSKITAVANELQANGIDLMTVKIVRDDDGCIDKCLMTWGMDINDFLA